MNFLIKGISGFILAALAGVILAGIVQLFLPEQAAKADAANSQSELSVSASKVVEEKPKMPDSIQENYPEFPSVPVGYFGQSFSGLYQSISGAIGYKTKYQSNADYEAKRKEGIENNPLLFKGYIVLHDSGLLNIDYDPEAKKMVIEYPSSTSDSDTYNLGSYIGSNAFGVSKEIKRVSRNIYRVELVNRYKKKKAMVSMEPDVAKSHDFSLALLYIVQLTPPYINKDDSGTEYHKATLNDPEEGVTSRHGMKAILRGMVVYNEKTGEVVYQERLPD